MNVNYRFLRKILAGITAAAVAVPYMAGLPIIGIESPTASLPVYAASANSGTSNHCTWVFSNGKLCIDPVKGSDGKMADYASEEQQPWYSLRTSISEVDIDEGVTSIGNYAFASLPYLSKADISQTVKSIGDSAFKSSFTNINGDVDVKIPDSVTSIGKYAFLIMNPNIDIYNFSQADVGSTGSAKLFVGITLKNNGASCTVTTKISNGCYTPGTITLAATVPDASLSLVNTSVNGVISTFKDGKATIVIPRHATTIKVYMTLGQKTAAYGTKLSSISLPKGFSWKEDGSTTVGSVGTKLHFIKFGNGNECVVPIKVTSTPVSINTITAYNRVECGNTSVALKSMKIAGLTNGDHTMFYTYSANASAGTAGTAQKASVKFNLCDTDYTLKDTSFSISVNTYAPAVISGSNGSYKVNGKTYGSINDAIKSVEAKADGFRYIKFDNVSGSALIDCNAAICGNITSATATNETGTITAANGATVILYDGKVENTAGGGTGIWVKDRNTRLIVNAGDVKGGKYGVKVSGPCYFVVNDGTITGGTDGVNITGSCLSEVYGGVISGGSKGYFFNSKNGEIIINGGTIVSNSKTETDAGNDSAFPLVVVASNLTEISGGTIKRSGSDTGRAIYLTDASNLWITGSPKISNTIYIASGNLNVRNVTNADKYYLELAKNPSAPVEVVSGTWDVSKFSIKNSCKLTTTVNGAIRAEPASSDCTIKEFAVDRFVGVIDDNAGTIKVNVDANVDLSKAVPSVIVQRMATVSPANGTAQNFSGKVSYTVTSQLGQKKTYTVTVSQNKGSDENQITSFAINGYKGSIDNNKGTIDITLPFGSKLNALAPTITTSAKASVSPAGGKLQDFSNPVTYKVTAESGKAKYYTVTVYTDKGSNEKCITSFSVDGYKASIDEGKQTISLRLPGTYNLRTISPKISCSTGATVTPNSGVCVDFTSPVSYKVTAQNGTSKYYSVSITREQLSSAKDITSFSIGGYQGVISEYNRTITVTLPNNYNIASLNPTIKVSPKATVYPTSGQYVNFSNTVTYTVTAEDGSYKYYYVTVNFISPLSSDNYITSFSIGDRYGVISGNSITIQVPQGINISRLAPKISVSSYASVNPSSGTYQDFTYPVTYVVTAQNGDQRWYTVNLIQDYPIEYEKKILSFSIGEFEGDINQNSKTISITLPSGLNTRSLTPDIWVSDSATVYPGSGQSNDFSSGVAYYTVMAPDGSTASYTVYVTIHQAIREPIGFTQFSIGGHAAEIDNDDCYILTYADPGEDLTQMVIYYATTNNAYASISNGTRLNFTSPQTITLMGSDGMVKDYVMVVIASDYDPYEYQGKEYDYDYGYAVG